MDGATGQNRDGLSGNLNGADAFLNHREDRGIFFLFNICLDACLPGCLCTHVCAWCPQGPEEDVRSGLELHTSVSNHLGPLRAASALKNHLSGAEIYFKTL